MPDEQRGGSHEQHVKAGEQSHKNMPGSQKPAGEGAPGGTHEQQAKAGEQSHKNTGGSSSQNTPGTSRGGSHEQHARAGEQSHKKS